MRTIVFTLADKDPGTNYYIWIYIAWLHYIAKNKVLEDDDQLIIFIDKASMDFLKKSFLHTIITKNINAKLTFIEFPSPKTLSDGFFFRYNLGALGVLNNIVKSDFNDTLFIYSDIDNIFRRPIRTFFPSVHSNTIYLSMEGKLADFCYLGCYDAQPEDEAMLQKLKNTPEMAGFTSGVFAYCLESPEKHLAFFSRNSLDSMRCEGKEKYFDQNSFNFNVYIKLLTDTSLHLNMDELSAKSCIAINDFTLDRPILTLMGDAGNESLHIEKIMAYMMLFS